MDNLVTALYGAFYNPQTGTGYITKSVVNGRVVWNIACDPNNTAVIAGIPRLDGEGLLCYLIRVLGVYNPAAYALLNGPQTITDTTFNTATLNSPVINTPIGITKNDVGLGNVDNTADLNKPISGPQTTYVTTAINTALAGFSPITVQNLLGGTPFAIPYQQNTNQTVFLPNGAAGLVLTANGPGLPPSWQVSSSLATNADNITGGNAGEILYQSATGVTSKLTAGTNDFVLKANGVGAAPSWVQKAPQAVAADTAGVSTNIAGGAAGSIPYQSGSGSTLLLPVVLPAGTTSQVLGSGTTPAWQTVDTAATNNTIVKRDGSGGIAGTAFTGTTFSGNSATASALTAVPGLVAGTYGNSGNFPVVSVNAGGQITNISTLPNPVRPTAANFPEDEYGDQGQWPFVGDGAATPTASSGASIFLDSQNQIRVSGTTTSTSPHFGLGVDAVTGSGPGYPTVRVNWLSGEIPVKLYHGPVNLFVLTNLGNIYAAGNNSTGQCGNGTVNVVPVLTRITGITDVIEFATNQGPGGGQFCMAIKADNSLWGWGFNGQGNLGNNATANLLVPTQILQGPFAPGPTQRQARKVYCFGSTGCAFSMIIDVNDFILGAGYNVIGNLGIATSTNVLIFTQAVGGSTNQADFLVGVGGISATNFRASVFAVRGGNVHSTGSNSTGELGTGTTTDRNVFQQILGINQITQITCSSNAANQGSSVAAIRSDGTLYVWGNNIHGQLANGTTSTQTSPSLPTGVVGVTFQKVRFSGAPNQGVGTTPAITGGVRIFALSTTGQMYIAGGGGKCFGNGLAYTSIQSNFLQPIQGGAAFVDFHITGGTNTTLTLLARTSNGELYSWGNNTNFAAGHQYYSAAAGAVLVPNRVQFL